jgi:hypothetical protein
MYESSTTRVLREGIPDEEDRKLAGLNTTRFVNMCGGRHVDAARSEVRDYERMGPEAYRELFKSMRELSRF